MADVPQTRSLGGGALLGLVAGLITAFAIVLVASGGNLSGGFEALVFFLAIGGISGLVVGWAVTTFFKVTK
jgi:uncharacterized membrane protein (Fun14 family)